jgi:hypothetical protein
MVDPGHIQEAERFGMPEVQPMLESCLQCWALVYEVLRCEQCGRRCCEHCRVYVKEYLETFCSEGCRDKRKKEMTND